MPPCSGKSTREPQFRSVALGLQRGIDGDGDSRMAPVVHIISIIDIIDIDLVGPVPDGRPGLRAGINYIKPEAPKLETRGAFDHHDGDVVDAKPVSTTEMGAEAVFRDAVSVIAATIVPATMLTLPISCALALPNVLPHIACFGFVPSSLTQMSRGIPAVRLMLGPPLNRFPGIATVLVPLFRPIGVVSLVLRRGLASVILLVDVALLPAGIIFLVSTVMLCDGNYRCTQHENQY
jgi:hypothetical protein